MRQALLLNSGLSWAAYQAGALQQLAGERNMRFDLCAGTGFGALNAALVACQEYEALHLFWQGFSWRKLLGINWKTPWRRGPLQLGPLKELIETHISEARLRDLGTQLLFNCLDVVTGQERIFSYPGEEMPLADALTAAMSLPGLTPPLEMGFGEAHGERQWVDGTLVNSFILHTVLQQGVETCWAIAAVVPEAQSKAPAAKIGNWRAVGDRSLRLNQSQDVRLGVNQAQQVVAASTAHRRVSRLIAQELAARVPDPETKTRLEAALAAVYRRSVFPLKDHPPARLYLLSPSQELEQPLWRFSKKGIRTAVALGYADAGNGWRQVTGEP